MNKNNLLIVFIVLSLVFASFAIAAKSAEKISKLDSRASEVLDDKGKVKVIVMMKETSSKKEKASMMADIKEIINENKIKNEFSSFNGFSASLNQEEIEVLSADDNVEGIYYDEPVHAFLQDSVPLIKANDTWNLVQNSLNLTGKGQTICIIDTGINYSHEDLRGCDIDYSKTFTLNGMNETYPLENEDHPYDDNTNETYTITMENYTQIAVHFTKIRTEEDWDYITILDGNNDSVISYSGGYSNFWSPSVDGDTLSIVLTSDESVNDLGFYIDQVINGTAANASESYDWSSCSKVIGGWDYVNKDANPMDDNGHGTHVAGIAAANGSIKGVAPGANLIAIKVLNEEGWGYQSDIVRGIDWCVDNASAYNITVISMSLGGDNLWNNYCDSYSNYQNYEDAINAAFAKNISVVVATGNDENTTHISAPACIQNAIPVTSSNKADAVSSFSNRNNLTLLIAPGGSSSGDGACSPGSMDANRICSTYFDGEYIAMSGTSMATPHVSGAIAIMRQYIDATGRKKTPSQIESALNLTGKRISDSGSGLNYSRINVLSALLSLDNQAPNIALVSPRTGMLDESENQTFTCNATDWQLKNMTFYLWNSTSNAIINNASFNVSGISNLTSTTITNLEDGTYNWNCKACDNASNCAYATNNFTLTIGSIAVALNSPATGINTSLESKVFNCTGQTADDLTLANITFYLWNSSGTLKSSTTIAVSGNPQSANMTYTFPADGRYYWNCLVSNNASGSAYAVQNFTITHDDTPPVVSLESPDDGEDSYVEDEEITFEYEVSDNIGVANCSLLIDGSVKVTEASITQGITQEFAYTFTSGDTYEWRVRCSDYMANSGSSSKRDIEIQSASSDDDNNNDGGGGNGGGSGGSSSTTSTTANSDASTDLASSSGQSSYALNPTKEETATGYSALAVKGSVISFILEVEKELNASNGTETEIFNESHKITINNINNESVNLTVASNPINLSINIGESKKLNISSADYYDLYIKLNSINISGNETKANLTIRTIKEPIKGFFDSAYPAVKAFIIKYKIFFIVIFAVILVLFIDLLARYYLLKRKKSVIRTREFSRYESYHMPRKKK